MIQNEIAAPLAAALAERGYASLTPVQLAVLNPEARGHDLLVSAQTGSGKTVAFGIAAAPELLDDGDTLPEGASPLALAIAPTRELALQVAAELRWLYAAADARIATCVGGMDYRTERRALDRGAHIVVGTPGRLRDHLERGNLDLSALRVAVLDEADEMLDLGFREDLEAILAAAPRNRRTLMFSATVPAAIEKLAQDFQHDSLRIVAMGEARQHGDISYRALTVAARDRENAIFNLLRYHEARTAIIFCKTRANVNHLLARMGNRGFRVVALSGELSQQERSHALQALRDGRARVCIATDVAARGIDLPGLELVIHADLPSNSETLLHRSGRTGRAGAKGVSALIVTPADQKKAQRLLHGARVVAEWGSAPSAEDVRARDDARMLDHPALHTPLDDMTIVRDLLARVGAEQIAAAFVQLWREGRPPPEELSDTARPLAPAPDEPREFGTSVWYVLPVGHTKRAEARWLLPKICEASGITRDAIGAIRVREEETFVQIATAEVPRFGEALEIEPDLTMRQLNGEPPLDSRPDRQAATRSPKQTKQPSSTPDTNVEAKPTAPIAPAITPSSAEPASPPRTARKKQRWSTAQKVARGRKTDATPSRAGKPAANKEKDRPSYKPVSPRRPQGGNAPPRRPKGRG